MGPPQITWRGETFLLARRQARALLYYLANAFAPVSRDKLLFLFWPDEPETKARRNLTRLISYLRRALPHSEVLLDTHESLMVNPEQIWVDAERFTSLCASDATREQAVSLYQGPFLMGFSLISSPEYDFWLTEEQGRYETLYLKTLADLVRVKKEQEAYASAIQYAQQYLAVDSLAEEIHRHLISLYTAQGNQAAALKQYETCVQVLEKELGVSPLPETSAVYENALKKRVSLARFSNKQTWAVLPSLNIPLIGRESAWDTLQAAYQQLCSGGVILISGEAGVGKSRLLQEFATREGRTVLAGSHYPTTQTLPYQALVGALRQALPQSYLWNGISPIWLGELTRLLPELQDHYSGLPQPLNVEPEQAKARLYEALIQVYLGLAAQGSSLLLCLDDLHWADEATLGWISAISGRLEGSQICILGTYRQEQREPLLEMQGALRREGVLAEVVLEGFYPQSIVKILEQVPGEVPSRALLASRLHKATGGNAFFLLETVRALLESEQLDAPPETLPLPQTVQETIQNRLARLTPLARQILDASAVLSPDLELALLWQTAGRSELEAADGLDELVQHQILREKEGVLEFRHELLQTTVYQTLNPWRRKLLHRRAGDALREVYGRRLEAVAVQMAYHYDAAGAYEWAVESYELAANAAQAVYAHAEAIGLLHRTISLLSEIDATPVLYSRLYEAFGINLANAGRFEEARAAYRQALSALSHGSSMSLARLYWRLAKTHLSQLHYEKVENHLEQALSALGEPPSQEESSWWGLWLDIQLDRLTLFAYLFDTVRSDALSQEIAPVIAKTGTLEQQVGYSHELILIDMMKNRYTPSSGTFDLVDTHLELAHASQNPRWLALAQFSRGYCLLYAGDWEEAEEWFLKSLDRARQFDFLAHEARCLAFLSTLYRLQGDVESTVKFSQLAGEKGDEIGSRHYVAHGLANTAWLAYRKGERNLALESARRAFQDFLDTKVPFAWLAGIILLAVYHEKHDIDQAMAAAETMLGPMQQRLPDDLTTALEKALHTWADQEFEATSDCLEKAVKLARGIGYL